MSKRFYITTAIDYVNGQPHLGHAYEKVIADVIARSRRSLGRETFFLSNSLACIPESTGGVASAQQRRGGRGLRASGLR